MIKKYSLQVTLYQYVKQLRMDRNRKEINFAKNNNLRIIISQNRAHFL